MEQYIALKEKYSVEYSQLNKKYNLISIARLVVIICLAICSYYYLITENVVFLFVFFSTLLFFFFLIKQHQKILNRREITKALVEINNDEIAYLKREKIPFKDGIEYADTTHLYSFDLDVFGKQSLFQNLNRTATYIGEKKLAELLLTLLPNEEIKLNQEAIKELSQKINWRQALLSLAKITKDSKEIYNKLIKWSKTQGERLPKFLIFISYASPIVLVLTFLLNLYFHESVFGSLTSGVFLFNLIVLSTQIKKIKKEIIDADKLHKIINQYSLIIEKIEKEEFVSLKSNALKEKLTYKTGEVSAQIKKLSSLFNKLDSINNVFAAALFNGIFLYHVRVLNDLLNWKKEYATSIVQWLDVMGEFEALNSIANFSHNNPKFTFPELNSNFEISFSELGHPLIAEEKRICNEVEFTHNRFIILTGSNMSGKSTFLRTLGINMILAGTGSPVCSSNSNLHPLDVIVSMRQSDSLADSESYFFAEVKRLKHIMNALDNKVCFVLLDEILRGTNSDDKRNGTIEVIKKIINKKAIGAIATHDMEICKTTDEFPNFLTNKCFEVEIIDNDLSFDYKLRDGICKNKSATFLMKKMEVI